jgi:hypothetical protein
MMAASASPAQFLEEVDKINSNLSRCASSKKDAIMEDSEPLKSFTLFPLLIPGT